MFEKILLKAEKNDSFALIILITFIITIILGILNYFIGSNSIFLIALISLTLSRPISNYIKYTNENELSKNIKSINLLYRHEKKLVIFWSIFIGSLMGFYLIFILPLSVDFSYQQAFVNKLSGNITQTTYSFSQVFLNNMMVTFLTFIISTLVFSGLIFVLLWNSSILAYYLYSFGSHKIALLNGFLLFSHGLLEIGGYIFAGIAGAVLSYRISKGKSFNHKLDKEFLKDFGSLIISSICLILIAAILETL